jgi:hypothetical protein
MSHPLYPELDYKKRAAVQQDQESHSTQKKRLTNKNMDIFPAENLTVEQVVQPRIRFTPLMLSEGDLQLANELFIRELNIASSNYRTLHIEIVDPRDEKWSHKHMELDFSLRWNCKRMIQRITSFFYNTGLIVSKINVTETPSSPERRFIEWEINMEKDCGPDFNYINQDRKVK